MRLKHIDILRGIAAMLVTIFHLARNSGLRYSFDYAKYGWVGVQIFFVISGFILPYSLYKTGFRLKNLGIFVLKRVIRIYPAYIAAILLGVALTIVTHREMIPTIALFSHLLFLNDIIGLPSNSPVFWTLAIEFQFYLLIGILYPYFITSNAKSIALVFVITLAAFIIKADGLIFKWFPFFGIGILVFNMMYTNLSNTVFWLAISALLVIAFIEHGIPHVIAGLFSVIFILYGAYKKETPIIKAFLFLGTISYSLYLTHWDMGRAVVRMARYLPFISDVNFLRVIAGVLLSILCGWLLYILVERRSAKLSASIKYKK